MAVLRKRAGCPTWDSGWELWGGVSYGACVEGIPLYTRKLKLILILILSQVTLIQKEAQHALGPSGSSGGRPSLRTVHPRVRVYLILSQVILMQKEA